MKRNFSVRIDQDLLEQTGRIAEFHGVKRARIIDHALHVVIGLIEQNRGALLSPCQLGMLSDCVRFKQNATSAPVCARDLSI